jgi:hypothetical protein
MSAVGWGTHDLIQGGRWIVGTYEQDQFLADGTFVLTWQLHWVAGWDPAAREYRATIADNYGHAGVMRGWIEGDRLTFETIGGAPARLRLTWDVSDPAGIVWRNEMSVGGGPWSLVEEYRCHPMGKGAGPPRERLGGRDEGHPRPRSNQGPGADTNARGG